MNNYSLIKMGSPFDISSLKECTVTTGMGTNFQCLQTQIFSLKPAGLVAPVTTQRRLAPWQTKTRPPLAPCPSRARALAHRAVDSQLLGQVEEVGEVKITLTAPMSGFPWKLGGNPAPCQKSAWSWWCCGEGTVSRRAGVQGGVQHLPSLQLLIPSLICCVQCQHITSAHLI